MKKEYFIQYSHNSVINGFALAKDMFKSIDVGIRDIETDFLFTSIQNMFSFPVFFVLESVIFEHVERIFLERNIPFYKFASDCFIIKIESDYTLKVIWDCTVDLVLNGLTVLYSLDKEFSSKRTWDKLIEFKNLV